MKKGDTKSVNRSMVPAIVESSLWHSKTPVEFIYESSINSIFLSLTSSTHFCPTLLRAKN